MKYSVVLVDRTGQEYTRKVRQHIGDREYAESIAAYRRHLLTLKQQDDQYDVEIVEEKEHE